MEGVASKIQEEISGLQSERAALLAKLEKIELALTKAQAAKVHAKYPGMLVKLLIPRTTALDRNPALRLFELNNSLRYDDSQFDA